MSIYPGGGMTGGVSTIPRQTIAFGTPIVDIFQAPTGPTMKMKVSQLRFECGGTANTVLLVNAKSIVEAYAAVASGGTSLILKKDPGYYSSFFPATRPPMSADNLIAANDYIAYQTANGRWVQCVVSAVSTDTLTGRVTCTIPAVGAQGIPANAKVAFFGLVTDVSPWTGQAGATLQGVASTSVEFGGDGRILAQADFPQAPILVYSLNATATCILHGGAAFASA